jgi:predicted nucleic acid-binding protein
LKISVAMGAVARLYAETAPFIYFVEANPQYIDRMDAIFKRLDSAKMQGFTSTITLTEVLMLPIRVRRHDLESAYRNILLHNTSVSLIAVSAGIAEQAAHLRSLYNIRTPDALHVATAIYSGCDAFLTNDNGLRRITEIQILVIDDLEVDPPPEST